jgi:signal peptidase I
MAEIDINTGHKRHIWAAVMLSLIMPGLGQIYCGKLARGLLLSILNTVPISLLVMVLLFKNLFTVVLLVAGSIVFGGIILLVALIDSIYLAKSVGPNYELKEYNRWYIYLLFIFIDGSSGILGSTSYIKNNISEAFRIPAASMYPTVVPQDRVLANKVVYQKTDPKRGDTVIFINPEDRRQNFIKRVVAIAGDTVEMKDNQLYINGQILERQLLPQSELDGIRIKIDGKDLCGDVFYEMNNGVKYKIFLAKPLSDKEIHDFAPITVPKNHCFVLGDNREYSHDSRDFGMVPLATVKGRVDWQYGRGKHWLQFNRLSTQ